MSNLTVPVITNETGLGIKAALEDQAALMGLLVGNKTNLTTWQDIRNVVRKGLAEKVFVIGDQLITKWTDPQSSTEYSFPFDVVAFRNVTLEDGDVVPGMIIQLHYAIPRALQFDAREAFYYTADGLAAGTYNIVVPSAWSHLLAGTYQFTLASAIPAGGQIVFNQYIADVDPSALTVSTYSSSTSVTAIETVAVTSGSSGTSLGNLIAAGSSPINSMHRAGYGYNRWGQSAQRQYLNSNKAAGAWWTPQNNYDRPESSAATISGFIAGFDEDFQNILTAIKIPTSLNTVCDDGSTEYTYDKFFLPSLEEEFIVPQISGVEGAFWEYWRKRSKASSPVSWYTARDQYRTYAVEAHSSAQTVRLRSAYRGYGYSAWIVSSDGSVYDGSAYGTFRCAPACVIC